MYEITKRSPLIIVKRKPPIIITRKRKVPEGGHHCHAKNCPTPCKPEMLMCARHWHMVPKRIQAAVWKHYRPGQCDDKSPSKEWFEAAGAAIASVARIEALKCWGADATILRLWVAKADGTSITDKDRRILTENMGWRMVRWSKEGRLIIDGPTKLLYKLDYYWGYFVWGAKS